jgi:hypothetical protein
MDIIIKEVIAKKELKKFVKFPAELYKDNQYWVTPLVFGEIRNLGKDTNPPFEYCEARYRLAYKTDKIVERVAAIINHHACLLNNFEQ